MSIYMMAAGSAYIAAADKSTAALIAATEGLHTNISGALQSSEAGLQSISFGGSVDLGGFGR